MKKWVIILLVVFSWTSFVSVYGRAEESVHSISVEEAVRLVVEAYNCNLKYRCEGGYTDAEIEQKAQQVFVDSLVPFAWKINCYPVGIGENVRLIIQERNGKSSQNLCEMNNYMGYFLYYPYTFIHEKRIKGETIDNCVPELYAENSDVVLSWGERSENRAKAKIKALHCPGMAEDVGYPCCISVDFQKTNDGWRISGGIFAEWILLGTMSMIDHFQQDMMPVYAYETEEASIIPCAPYCISERYFQAVQSGGNDRMAYEKITRGDLFDASEARFSHTVYSAGKRYGYYDIVMRDKLTGEKVFVEAVVPADDTEWHYSELVESPFLCLLNGQNNVSVKPYEEPQYVYPGISPVTSLLEVITVINIDEVKDKKHIIHFLTTLYPGAEKSIEDYSPATGDDTPRTVLFCTVAMLLSAFGAHIVWKTKKTNNTD